MKLYVLLCSAVLSTAIPFKDINDGARILSENQLDSYSIPIRGGNHLQLNKPRLQEDDDEWTIISRMRDMHIPPSADAKDYYAMHEQTSPNRFLRTKRSTLKFDGDSKSVDPGLQSPPPRSESGNGLSFEGSSQPSSSDGKDGDKKFLPGLFGIQGPGIYGGGYPTNQPYYGGGYNPIYGNGYGGGYPGGYPGGGYGGGYPTAGYPGGGYPGGGYLGGGGYPGGGHLGGGYPGGGLYPGGGGVGSSSSSASASSGGGGGGGFRPPINNLHGNGYYPGGYGNGYGNGYYPHGGISPILGGGIGPGGPGLGGPQFGIIGGGFFKDGKEGNSASSTNPAGVKGSVSFEK